MKNYKILILTAFAGFLLFIFVFVANNPQIVPASIFNGLKIAILVIFSVLAVDLLSLLLINVCFRRIDGKQPSKILKLAISFILYAVCTFIILRILGQDTTSFTITSTLLTAIVGIAIKDPLSHLLSGIFIQIDRPFEIGDSIEFRELRGVVESIDWRSTDIRLPTGELNYIPNALIINDAVKLIGADRVYRTVDFTAAATIPPHRVMNWVTQAVLDQPSPNINLDRPVFVRMWSHGLIEINYKLFYYPKHHSEAIDLTDSEIRCRIWYALNRISGENQDLVIRQEYLLKSLDNFEFFRCLSVDAKRLLIEKSPRLLFDRDESLNARNLLFPAMFLVVTGSIAIEQEIVTNADTMSVKPFSRKPKANSSYELKPKVVDRVATNLAQYIGPVAYSLTSEAAKQVSCVYWLYENLAKEIEDLAQREAFLSHRPTAPCEHFQTGDFFGEMALFLGHPLPMVKMIATEETELLAFTPAALVETLHYDNISIDTLEMHIVRYHRYFLWRSSQEVSLTNLNGDELSKRIRQHLSTMV